MDSTPRGDARPHRHGCTRPGAQSRDERDAQLLHAGRSAADQAFSGCPGTMARSPMRDGQDRNRFRSLAAVETMSGGSVSRSSIARASTSGRGVLILTKTSAPAEAADGSKTRSRQDARRFAIISSPTRGSRKLWPTVHLSRAREGDPGTPRDLGRDIRHLMAGGVGHRGGRRNFERSVESTAAGPRSNG